MRNPRPLASVSLIFFAEGRIQGGPNEGVSLGIYPVLSVQNGRERAKQTLLKLSLGVDPIDEVKRKAKAARTQYALVRATSVTLAGVIDDYFKIRPIKSETGYRSVLKVCFSD